MRLFFVMGAPKSGTTWLQTIMNAHPQVSCFGEGHFVDRLGAPLQALLQNYNRQLTMVADLVYSGTPYYKPLAQDEITALIRATVVNLMRRANPPPQSIWWGDKTPAYSGGLPLLNQLFPACRFIDVLRDPRDVAVSMLYHGRRSGAIDDVRNDTVARREIIATAVTRWLGHIQRLNQAAPHLGERLLRVRYQDLLERPDAVLQRLFAHLDGVAVTPDIIAHVRASTGFAAMSGGRAPGEVDDGSFFRSGTVGQHIAELRDDERTFIDQHLGAAMRAEGLA